MKRNLLALIPLAAILLNICYISAIFQPNFGSEDNKSIVNLKIATYNLHGYYQRELKGTMGNIAQYIQSENVDVACFQEFKMSPEFTIDTMRHFFASMPYYIHYGELAVLSKYPITDSSLIHFNDTSNSAMWVNVDVNGLGIRFFNNHFQTTNINQSGHEIAQLKDKGITDPDGKEALDVILDRLHNNAFKRTEQVNIVRSIMDTTSRLIVVCGDFNDTPASYAYNKIQNGLCDGFKTCGRGYCYTYKAIFKLLRLDYIFYSKELIGVRYYSPNLEWSDHKPVFLELSFRK